MGDEIFTKTKIRKYFVAAISSYSITTSKSLDRIEDILESHIGLCSGIWPIP